MPCHPMCEMEAHMCNWRRCYANPWLHPPSLIHSQMGPDFWDTCWCEKRAHATADGNEVHCWTSGDVGKQGPNYYYYF